MSSRKRRANEVSEPDEEPEVVQLLKRVFLDMNVARHNLVQHAQQLDECTKTASELLQVLTQACDSTTRRTDAIRSEKQAIDSLVHAAAAVAAAAAPDSYHQQKIRYAHRHLAHLLKHSYLWLNIAVRLPFTRLEQSRHLDSSTATLGRPQLLEESVSLNERLVHSLSAAQQNIDQCVSWLIGEHGALMSLGQAADAAQQRRTR